MASIFAFRTRSPDRDRQTDEARFGQLSRALDELAAGIEAERTGIRNRYEAVSANAAFLVEAMENSAVSVLRAREMDQLTESLKACLRRIEALGRQKDFVAGLRHSLDIFADEGREIDEESSARLAQGEALRQF
ncbi:hypothetical protein IG197_15965 [Aminobacter sp. SR38]|jgi:hypothetical protein|uniref:hypothetical protein n=1 Tax=Aminobacter sp. SR38 TaxID=2774562 RepID=UPI00177C0618|nr:hypothetical protein [Aminobacter sp. SR38]QOF69379.1 hypothetical protein IG197_15965 [Aminobacter sp. SR38]